MHPVLCAAIAARRLLIHLHGRNTAGHDALSAWLRPGQSRTDPEGGWRMYLVDALHGLQMLPETFAGPRDGYNPADPHFVEIYCRLPGHAAGAR